MHWIVANFMLLRGIIILSTVHSALSYSVVPCTVIMTLLSMVLFSCSLNSGHEAGIPPLALGSGRRLQQQPSNAVEGQAFDMLLCEAPKKAKRARENFWAVVRAVFYIYILQTLFAYRLAS